MHVVVHHQIKDPKAFWTVIQSDPTPPEGLKALGFYPSTDDATAFCIYEADSLDNLRRFLDGELRDASRNTYHVVNTEAAMGLPA